MEEFKTELQEESLTMTNYLNVPGKMDTFDEEPSEAESPTTPHHAACTPVSLAARKAAAISGRKKKKKTASSTSLASNTFQVWKII